MVRAHLAVSADTAADISGLLKTSPELISWCHPAPDPVSSTVSHGFVQDSWYHVSRAGIKGPYILLLPQAGGSYKIPRWFLRLFSHRHRGLLAPISGVGAERRADEFVQHAPALDG